ncbi:DUF4429 domain-containing protein [Kribbella sp. NPDC005582]|uniref:DUF4429 domain-containing protein n=1 Tax=Kribbella sp. NPDC005582 TaxID=3156893 RepID=UPI0033A6423E
MERLSGDELRGRNATMVWDGLGTIQLTYDGSWIKQTSSLTRQVLRRFGRRTIPVEALAGVEVVMPGGREQPTIRLMLREHADPVPAVAGGQLNEQFDPYRLDFEADQWLLAAYRLPLSDLRSVEWKGTYGLRELQGYLRFTSSRTPAERPVERKDPETVVTKSGDGETDALFFGAMLLSMIDR